ncbi:hypothetical protein UFOVP1596_7 [uncultured Caudovirales phage]|uniref:DUF6046 domain-containing protein n=1 Tax=uncultured Caudovirales phage TaxID=2100421 RepID=A0A6J5SRQ6_9CAUD|nr:hypothetical protein UFOVP1596_7 [uncultured Caudovirales phage]
MAGEFHNANKYSLPGIDNQVKAVQDFSFPSEAEIAKKGALIIENFGLQSLKGAILKKTIALQNELLQKPQGNKTGYSFDQPELPDEKNTEAVGFTGTPVFSNLKILGDTYEAGGVKYRFPDILINICLLSVHSEKLIIETPVQGRDIPVYEYISGGADQVTIQGTFTGPQNDIYPKFEMRDLNIALKCPKALRVVSWYLQLLDIHNIVIRNKDIGQEEGAQSYQKFQFMGSSDLPTDLKIKA